jgi:hypothetical protein
MQGSFAVIGQDTAVTTVVNNLPIAFIGRLNEYVSVYNRLPVEGILPDYG